MDGSKLIILNTSSGKHLIDTDTIIRVEALSNYCRLYFTNGKTLVVARILKWFENHLPQQSFLRMHRSHLVNNIYLKPNQRILNGFHLLNGEFIQVARRKKRQIMHQLQYN